MSVELENKYFVTPEVLKKAAAPFPSGSFVEVDDVAFELNGLGRKIVQTMTVQIDGRHVSVGYIPLDGTSYDLLLGEENPVLLGESFERIISDRRGLYAGLHEAFGGTMGHYNTAEMVVAIVKAERACLDPSNQVEMMRTAAAARAYVKRAYWIMKNRVEAFARAPVNWAELGL